MKASIFLSILFLFSVGLPAQDLVVEGNIGQNTNNPTEAIDLNGLKKNIKMFYTHIGETGAGAATVIANKARVSQTIDNRVEYSHSNADGVSAIELLYAQGISFFTRDSDELNPTVEGEEFFSYDNRGYERMRIWPDGRVRIGAGASAAQLTVGENSPDNDGAIYAWSFQTGITGAGFSGTGVKGSGGICDFDAVGSGTNYCTTSSRRWKRNIQNLPHPLKKLSQLRGVSFTWDEEHGGHDDIGFIAEEVGKVLPSIVVYENNGVDASSMDYSMMTPILVEAAKAMRQEYQAKFEEQESEIADLKQELAEIKALLKVQVSNTDEE